MPSHDRMIQLLQKLIVSGTKNQFKLFFHRYHEADIAEAVEDLSDDERTQFFLAISGEEGADIFEEMDIDDQIDWEYAELIYDRIKIE